MRTAVPDGVEAEGSTFEDPHGSHAEGGDDGAGEPERVEGGPLGIVNDTLDAIERDAVAVSAKVTQMMHQLRTNLHQVCGASEQYVEAYDGTMETVCGSVDQCVHRTVSFLSKCFQLRDQMKPINDMALQIKEIRRELDAFENLVKKAL